MERLYHTEPGLRTPVYVVDENALIHNLEILQRVAQRTGCHILLAQKAFSMFRVYPLIGQYLAGATASGLFEARLAHEEMPGRENHVFAPAYTPAIQQFHLQPTDDRVEIGGYPIVNVYANLHLKRTRIFVAMYHINAGMGNAKSFLAPHYPLNSRMLKIGVSWNFYD